MKSHIRPFVVNIRVNSIEHRAFRRCAAKSSLTLSEWARRELLKAARKVLR
jgi:hypothetical protein